MSSEFLAEWMEFSTKLILPSVLATFRIVGVTMIFGMIFGFILSILLTLYSPNGLNPKKIVYKGLNFLVNTVRSFPILLLIVAVMPLTRKIVGTTVGEAAVVIPLTIASTCFIARALENVYENVDYQLIEAAKAFGASDIQIILKVIVKESVPGIISVATLATITYIAGSTIAGAVGGGGIGAIALNYGYQSFNNTILYTSVFVLFLMVQLVQTIGNWLYKKSL